jgi:hypothetical protein
MRLTGDFFLLKYVAEIWLTMAEMWPACSQLVAPLAKMWLTFG